MFKNHHSVDNLTEITTKTQCRQQAHASGAQLEENALTFVPGNTCIWDLEIARITK
jgi:hypothetical protein